MSKTETAPKTRRKPRRNYAKEFERLQFYLETIIRVKLPREGEPPLTIVGEAEIRAYRDIQDYIRGSK